MLLTRFNYTVTLLLTLTSCSYLTDFLLEQDTGISVDAQLGDTENKVKTGLGKLGYEDTNTVAIEDSKHIAIKNSDDRYHITTKGDTKINVYETNPWLYLLFGLLAFGKPALNWLWGRKTKIKPHEQVTYTSTSRVASTYRDNASRPNNNNR